MKREIYREIWPSTYSEEIKGKNYIVGMSVSETSITHYDCKGIDFTSQETKVKLSLRSSPESKDSTWHIEVAFTNEGTIEMLKALMVHKTKIIVWEGYGLDEKGKNIFDGYDRQVQKIIIIE